MGQYYLTSIRILSKSIEKDGKYYKFLYQLRCFITKSTVCALNSLSAVTWQKVRVATSSDVDMNLLLATIESGIPKYRHEMAQSIREYHQFRDELYSVDGVVIYKDRVVIPPSLRNEVLLALHAAHQGVTSMTSRAEASVFWPGITSAIATTRARCEHCNRIAPSQPNASPFQPVLRYRCILSNASALTSLHTKVCSTSALSTDIRIGPSLRRPLEAHLASLTVCDAHLLHTASPMNLLQMVAANLC